MSRWAAWMAIACLPSCGGATAKGAPTKPVADASVAPHVDARAPLSDAEISDARAHGRDAFRTPSYDAARCDGGCLFGATICTPDDRGVETCGLLATGCTGWGPVVPCGIHEACEQYDAAFGSSALCMCNPPPCTTASTFCDGDGGIFTCAVDDHGCFYEAGTTPCAAPNICFFTGCDIGLYLGALCLPPCADGCGPDASGPPVCTGAAPEAGCACPGGSWCGGCGP